MLIKNLALNVFIRFSRKTITSGLVFIDYGSLLKCPNQKYLRTKYSYK